MGERGRPRAFDRDVALRKAMGVFWAQGYEGTSMTDLTTAMSVASPSIYACFGSKESLFRQAVEMYGEVEGAGPRRALEDAPTAREGVAAMLASNADSFADPATPPGCMVVLSAVAGTTKSEDVRNLLIEARQNMREMVRQRLLRGQADGDLPQTADLDRIAGFYNTVLQGMSIQSRDGASREDLQATIDCAMLAWDRIVT
jgi:AcrR family transcriptional regulator